MGGFLYGLARIFAVAFAPTPASPRAVRNSIAQAGASIVSAGIGGYYVAPAALYSFHIQEPDLRGLISVMIGIGFWQAIPALQTIIDKFLVGYVARALGVKIQENKETGNGNATL